MSKNWKQRYVKIAEELFYTDEVIEQIKKSRNERDAELILANARREGKVRNN